MEWLKRIREWLRGDWIDEVVDELKERNRVLGENVETLRQQAKMDGEDLDWFIRKYKRASTEESEKA
jgi:hypothetical protein